MTHSLPRRAVLANLLFAGTGVLLDGCFRKGVTTESATTSSAANRLAVVFLHSAAGSPRQWEPQLAHLAGRVTTLAPALPGHLGTPLPSDPPSIDAMGRALIPQLEALRVPILLVGHSAGAAVALAIASARPELVKALLLDDPAGDLRASPAAETESFLAALRSEKYTETIEAFWNSILANARPETRRVTLEDLHATPQKTMVYVMTALSRFDPVTPLKGFHGPAAITLSPLNEGPDTLPKLVPGLDATAIPNVSHWVHLDAPDAFNRLLDRTIERVLGAL